jgi:hypothetical protein
MSERQYLSSRNASEETHKYARDFDEKFPGVLDFALEEYEKRSGNFLDEVDTFVYQVARIVLQAAQTGEPCMATVTNAPKDECKFTAQYRDGELLYGVVGGGVAKWLRMRMKHAQES